MSTPNQRKLRLILLLIVGGLKAVALEPTTPLADYGRQSWVMENGLPQNSVHALLQTRDGYVWLGTEAGLVRFDGSAFAIFDRTSKPSLPGADIRCLTETKDGALWIGTSEGLARLKDGAVRNFTTGDGLPGNSIRSLAEDADGVLWILTDAGLARLNGEKFETAKAGDGLPAGTITSLTIDGANIVWVATTEGLSSRVKGQWLTQRIQGTQPNSGIEFVQTLPGGLVLGSKSDLLIDREFKKAETLRPGRELPGSRVQALLVDREKSLWIGTNGGLCRWINGQLQKLPVTDPLASASILSLFEDREGNMWVGTETGGLHILRDQRFRTIGTHEGLSSDDATTVVEDGVGTLWVGTRGSGLNAVTRNASGTFSARTYTVRDGLASNVILSLATASNGDLWVGTPDGLSLIRHGHIDSFTSADGLPDDFVRSLLVDADGSLWVGTRRGLTHWPGAPSRQRMETYTQAKGLGSDLVGAMARDSRGNLWIATLAGLSRLQDGKIANYTTANGLSSNVVTSLSPRADGTLFVGTQDHGWSVWNGERFSVAKPGSQDATSIHAIVADDRSHLWFATGTGIARCDLTQMSGCSHWIEFGPADGLRSRETATNSHPSAWRSRDGHLWFATPKGLVEIDPTHFPVNSVPPPVVVERFAADDIDQQLHAASVRIPAGHSHFQFDYAGLSLVAPQKVRYRYMLDGFDRGWTDAGSQRVAYYTNIPPGRYTFRVQAANNDGLWNTEGAALQFELRPHFYQTLWFYILLAVATAALIALLLKRRLLVAEREFKAVLGERSRIAREIHDTLAQGYVGISVQLEVLSELLRQNKVEAASQQLDTARGYVREGLADARQSIWALRSQDTGENTLPVKLRRATEQADGHGTEASFSLYGAYRSMSPDTEREYMRVAQEAIHNVKKHAGAQHLSVRLDYGPAEIALEVRDDGRGFVVGNDSASPPGHYGLTGMRERAASIGGALEVTSELGVGTTVRLSTPAPTEAQ
jgi:ligand-binding sensor domain-containing protein/signal transduction histidine kinase